MANERSPIPFYRLVRPDSLLIEDSGKAVYLAGSETSFLSSESGREFDKLVARVDETR